MRILMLGNSYTFTNDMPKTLAEITGAEVVHHTRGGARLAEQLNPETELGARTRKALEEERWDYVVLQEMSNAPVKTREKFLQSAAALCDKIHAAGAKPVFYLTWAYQKDGAKLKETGLDYEEMYRGLQEAYREAALAGDGLLADVGTAFYQRGAHQNLFAADGSHPNEEGSRLAAEIIAAVIMEDYDLSEKILDDSFSLYDLKVEVVATDRPMVCGHQEGDYFLVEGENLVFPQTKSFSMYALAALLPILPAKQRPLQQNDWMLSDSLIACPDPNCGAKFKITRTHRRTLKHGDCTVVPVQKEGQTQ